MPISPQSEEFFSKKNKLVYSNFKKKPNIKSFLNLIKKGIIPRPHYALSILLAAKQASDLGYKKIKIIELGCYNFDGLVDLENYAKDIQKFIKIELEIYGFTLKDGLPKYKPNVHDRLYRWSPGDYSINSTDKIDIDKKYVIDQIGDIYKDTDLTKFIL